MTGVTAVQQSSVQASGAGGRDYTVRSGDTLSEIAASNGVSLQALIRANPQISNPDLIRPGEQVSIPAGGGAQQSSYTVQRGDTLSGIADRFGTTWQQLARDNGISNPNLIHPGQRIAVGGSGGGGVTGTGGVTGPGGTPGAGTGNVLATAQQYLGRNASELQRDTSDDLPMQNGVPANVCCANFVSAVLIESGAMPASLHTNRVADLNTNLRGQGWTEVSPQNARPGDVVIIQGGGVSHTEIYAGNGRMIGSNNVNADGTQKVSYNNLSWALDHGAVILRAPAGTGGTGGTTGTGGATNVGDINTPAATREGRQDQAVAYFQSQGWTRAQAVGIVANLDAESGMDANIRQIGGGPGYGLAQWEGPRQRDFQAWAGKPIQQSTFAEQLRFIQHELSTTESGAANRLRGTTSADEAARVVCRYYERPADIAGDSAERAVIANRIFNR